MTMDDDMPPTYPLDVALRVVGKVLDAGIRGPVLRTALAEALRLMDEEPERIRQWQERRGAKQL